MIFLESFPSPTTNDKIRSTTEQAVLLHGHCLGLQPSDELSFNGSHMYTEKTVLYQDA